MLMKNSNFHIDYAASKCVYSIASFQQSGLLLNAHDIYFRKTASLNITNQLLKEYKLTTDEFQNMIKKQMIFQGSFKKHLLKHDHKAIYFCFDYPRCPIKEICFGCEWIMDDATQEIFNQAKKNVIQALEKSTERFMRSSFIKYEKLIEQKIEVLFNNQQSRFLELSASKTRETNAYFADFSTYEKTWIQEHCKKTLQDAVNNLIDSNHRYFDEFLHQINGLKADISICDQNIKEIDKRMKDVETMVTNQTDSMKKYFQDTSIVFKQKSILVSSKFECFEKLIEQQRKRVDERFDKFYQPSNELFVELSQLFVFKKQVNETFSQLRIQLAEIENRQTEITVLSNTSLSPQDSVFSTPGNQDIIQTPIQVDINEKSPNQETEEKQIPSPFDNMNR